MEQENNKGFDAAKTFLFEEEAYSETNIAFLELTKDIINSGMDLAAYMVKNILSMTDFKFFLILKIPNELNSLKLLSLILQFFYSIQPTMVKNRYGVSFNVLLHDRANFEKLNKIHSKKLIYSSILKSVEEIDFSEEDMIELKADDHFENFKLEETLNNLLEKIKKEAENSEEVGEFKFSNRSCIGGTFDHLHLGHKLFLSFGALTTKYLLVGVTSQQMLQKKKNFYVIEGNAKRRHSVAKFLSFFDKELDFSVVEITDGLGPYKESENYYFNFLDWDSLIITSEPSVVKGGEYYNKKRVEAGLPEVKLVIADLVDSGEDGKLSSTLIRNSIASKCSEELKIKIEEIWEKICGYFQVNSILREIW